MKNILCVRKDLSLTLILSLVFSVVVVSVGTASGIPVISQSSSTTRVYLDPPTINGTAVAQEFTVNINISDAQDIILWQTGLTFDATVLNCTGFFEGEFLKDASGAPPSNALWIQGTINNTSGVITAYGSNLLGDYVASGSGRLAYLNFTVKASGISDLHLRDVTVVDFNLETVPSHIVDVYTVIVDTTPHTVVTLSNSTFHSTESRNIQHHSLFCILHLLRWRPQHPAYHTGNSGKHYFDYSKLNFSCFGIERDYKWRNRCRRYRAGKRSSEDQ
jgi:hypothetical protein